VSATEDIRSHLMLPSILWIDTAWDMEGGGFLGILYIIHEDSVDFHPGTCIKTLSYLESAF
jgi:hypothetical protein